MALKCMPPVEEVIKERVKYVPIKITAPKCTGIMLRILAWAAEMPVLGNIIKWYFMRKNRLPQTLSEILIPDAPMFLPEFSADVLKEPATSELHQDLELASKVAIAVECLPMYSKCTEGFPFLFWTIRDYADAYRSGSITPFEVAERFITAVHDSERQSPPMSFFISFDIDNVRAQAAESTKRFASGCPLSVLDGILVAVKDDIDCLPYESKGGTTWLHKFREVKRDAVCVSRLRDCGVVFAGKTNMHELGMGTTGSNPLYGTSRNPYNTNRYTGGSSAGSSAVVASGLCPAALGTDTGGSIRIPAALCGVVGLKSTFGRITCSGLLPVGYTMLSVGPIAATVEDVLLLYSAILGSQDGDVLCSHPPPARMPILRKTSAIGDLKLGRYTDWFFDSSNDVNEVCDKALHILEKAYSVKIMEIDIPELEELRNGHLITAGSEILSFLSTYYKYGMKKTSYESRVTLAFFEYFKSNLYVNAQRLRRRLLFYHMEIFKTVDIIVTPTTAITAPLISSGALDIGESDLATSEKLMRFVLAANFLGFPAITIPVGHDSEGLPVGLQLIGRPWQEASLLRLAFAFEELYLPYRRRPMVFYDMLK